MVSAFGGGERGKGASPLGTGDAVSGIVSTFLPYNCHKREEKSKAAEKYAALKIPRIYGGIQAESIIMICAVVMC